MNMLKLLLALSLCFSHSPGYAEVVALGDSKKIEDFKDYMEAHPQDLSLKDTLILKSLKRSDALLESKYALAVKGLIMTDLKPSIYLFKEISNYPKDGFIFSDNKLELIYESFFRLSNLDRNNTDYWIKKGILTSPNYKPSEDIFNPSIIGKHKKTLNELNSYFYKLSTLDFTPKWSTTYVDGKLEGGVFKVHPQSNYLVKVYKDGHYPYEKSFLGESLIKLSKIELKKLNLGTCQNPSFKKVSGQKIDKIFFSKSCIKSKKDVELLMAEKAKINIYPKTSETFASRNSLEQKFKSNDQEKKSSFFSKRKNWFYIAGAVALTSIAIGLSNNNSGPVRIKPVQHDQN